MFIYPRERLQIYTALNENMVNYYAVWGLIRYNALLRNS